MKTTERPGIVVRVSGGLGVTTGDGVLLLDEIQIQGKRPAAAADFARGRRDFIGSVLD
jgi:methionyl-tRNA formyltransferase